jgi:hypothetical protein
MDEECYREWVRKKAGTMAEERHTLWVRAGRSLLPFFAEYPYFLWGEVNYDSEGDCEHPTDRTWEWLVLTNRETEEALEIVLMQEESEDEEGAETDDWGHSSAPEERIYEIEGSVLESVRLAAYLTAMRSSGQVIDPRTSEVIPLPELEKSLQGLSERLARAERVSRMFLDPVLAPFDSHAWWGGWKWCSEFSTDLTSGLRLTLKAVEEKQADPEFVEWLRDWWNEPPQPFHREGVRYALYALTGVDPAKKR